MSNDAIETAARDADSALRTAERDVMNERSFDATRFAPKRDAALAAIEVFASLAPEHANLAALRQRVVEMGGKADGIVVDAFRQAVEGAQRAAARDVAALEGERERGRGPRDLDPDVTADKQVEWVKKVRTELDAARERLTSERGQAALADVEAWIAATEKKIEELRLLGEAFALFRAEADVEGYGEIAFGTALDSVEWNFSRDPEKVVLAWDACKKLVGPFRDERFAEIPEIKAVLARHAALEARVATELRPLIARLRVAPLIQTATYTLDNLKRDTDNLDEERVLTWRQKLREEMAPLERDWADDPDAQDFLAKCARAFRRSEEDLGDKIVLREIQAAEVFVRPLVERVERGLVLGSAPRVRESAPRLRARLAALAPFRAHQRAQVLEARAQAALGRIEEVLGAAVAREIAEAESVPRFEVDIATDTKVQAVLGRLDQVFERYHEEYVAAQEAFEKGVDLVDGGAAYGLADTIESASRSMIRLARDAEEVADELRKLDRAHPALDVVESRASKLVKRAQAWKERLGKKIEYAGAIERARSAYQDARHSLERARSGDPHDAMHGWPDVIERMVQVAEAAAAANAILPDDHDEADAWDARAQELRREAAEKLTAACVAEVTRRAIANDSYGVQDYADALARALPDAPENAQIAAIIAGTADARQKATAEIQTRAALIERRAEEAAQAVRARFDEWAASRQPIVALAGTIVQNLEQYQGKWVEGHARHLGRTLGDEADELHGDVYWIEYDPAVRDALFAGMKRLDDLYAEMAAKVAATAGIEGLPTRTQHYPRDARYLCEIVGVTSYTPRREVRDNYGRVLGTIDGHPYPVPRVVIRGVATTFFVIQPGEAPSLDAMDVEGLVG